MNNFKEIMLKSAFLIYIPSLKREVKFTPLTVAQHRSLYECASDTIFQTKFIITTFNIIKSNCLEPDIISSLNILDYISILVGLRINLLGTDIIKINGIPVSLQLIITKLKNYDVSYLETVKDTPNFIFHLNIPKIIDSYNIEKELRETQKRPDNYIEIFSDIYATELVKIIKEIQYRVDETQDFISVDYSSKTATERLQIVSSLPADIAKILREYLIEYYDVYLDILTLTVGEFNELLDLKADFFVE